MPSEAAVMILDDEPIVGERLKPLLEREGFQVEVFTESPLAVERLKEKSFTVLVTDMKMRGLTGMDVLRFVQEKSPGTKVIVITGYATIETNREAEVLGAFQFIAKPFKMKDLVKLVQKASKS